MASPQKQAVLNNYKARLPDVYGLFETHRPLSNFHLEPFTYKDVIWPSSENAYQAMKGYPSQYELFASLKPMDSRNLGQRIQLPKDWNYEKYNAMYEVLTAKFKQCPIAREVLTSTKDYYIEETNWWKDQYWGVFEGVGENNLGKILMNLRTSILNNLL